MTADLALRTVAVWAILVLAVANGALREAVLIPWLGTSPGLVLSGLLLSGLILAVAHLFLPWMAPGSAAQACFIGILWLLLTLVFEFSFGLASGKPLSEILAAYTLREGNLWPIVMAVTLTAPWLMARLRGWF